MTDGLKTVVLAFPLRMWRNWQTRWLQVPVGATPWRFESSHPQLAPHRNTCPPHPAEASLPFLVPFRQTTEMSPDGAIFKVIDATIGLRVSEEEEYKGLDIGEHGMESYSGFQIFITQ